MAMDTFFFVLKTANRNATDATDLITWAILLNVQ